MLARYAILRELGRGATGAIYAARDRETGATVALKRIDPALLRKSGADAVARLLKHARAARLLKHPNIVAVHDAGEVGGTVYVAMEMLEGKSLRRTLDEGPLPLARAIGIARDLASGLAHAHLEGVVHRALKPSNVIVLPSGAVKITDFGTGQAGPGYASPEQSRGEALDHRSDVYSLGVLLFEMLAQRPPSRDGSPAPSEVNPNVPRALDAIVLGMLAAQPSARMAGVPILLRELQRLEEGLGLDLGASAAVEEPRESVPPPAPAARPRRLDLSRSQDPAPTQDAARLHAVEELRHGDRTTDHEAFDYQKAMAIMERESRRERSSGARPVKLAAFALAVLVMAAGVITYFSGQWDIAAGRVREAVAAALASSRATAATPAAVAVAPSPVAETKQEPAAAPVLPAPKPVPPKPPVAAPAPPPHVESVAARAPELPAPAEAPPPALPAAAPPPEPARATPQERPRVMQAEGKIPEQKARATARLVFAISPAGELYIDGKHRGTTPPVTNLDLDPGMHRIEVRSGSRTPYLAYITVQPGDVRRIRHDFDTRGAVHPPESPSWRASHRPAHPER